MKHYILGIFLLTSAATSFANQGLYVGILGGWGDTNWSRFASNNIILQSSLPESASSQGLMWGVLVGNDFSDHFGAELRYQHFANSTVNFAQYNDYPPAGPDFNAFSMSSNVQNIELLSKIQANVTDKLQAYSLLGASYTMRDDILANVRGFGGVFGGGLAFEPNAHWSHSIEFQFVTGNASVDLYPAEDYLPFLTAFSYKIGYYF